jgi:CrcB protein
MKNLLLAGLGGFLGTMLRFGLATGLARLKSGWSFPIETLLVNVTGCLAIGFLAGVFEVRGVLPPATRAFLFVGVLGGYTTFSAFGAETFQLLRAGQFGFAALSVGLQVSVGLAAVWLGDSLGRMVQA